MTQTSPTVRVDQHGGADNMHLVDLQVGEPGPGEIRIRHQGSTSTGLTYDIRLDKKVGAD